MNTQTLSLEDACHALREGRAIVFPTETFYGLGCNALDPDAVGIIFSIKKRALNMPLPVVIAAREEVGRVAAHVPDTAALLMERFWPGPLSIVLPAHPEVPDLLTANAGRIAVRFSPHPAVLELCIATGMVLVASSANISGEPSAARREDLSPELLAGTAGIYEEGPPPPGGLSSTVVDVVQSREGSVVRILRQGVITESVLRDAGFAVENAAQECV